MEVDPLFVGPAALAKSYRFVGDPRDGQQYERLKDLSEDPHGIYDCTHCFNCIEACPKGVAPMSQIMRLRRIASADHKIEDRNNGYRHEHAFVQNIEKYGTLHEANLLPDSYGGKFHPRAVPELVSSLPVVLRGLLRRKVTPAKALYHHKLPDQKEVRRIFKEVAEREEKGRYELNLYIEGYEEDEAPAPVAVGATVAQTEDVASGAEDKEPATTAAPAAPAAPAEPEAPQAAEPAAESTPQPEAEPQADDDEDDTTSQPDSEPAPEPPAEPAPAGDPGGSEPAPTADAESDRETVPAEPEPEPPTEPDERPVGHVHGEGDEGVPQDGDQTADNEEDQG
jgi:heterodisulfide reductase subunit C